MSQRFAMVGCGAIAETYFLPVLAKNRKLCSELWLVDRNIDRLRQMAVRFSIPTLATEITDVLDDIDVAVIATPHDTHSALSQTLFAAGKHVLCEKPMSVTPDEGAAMIESAQRAKTVLMVNNARRIFPAYIEIKRVIDSGVLGRPLGAVWTEGKKFNWPTASGFYFTQRSRHNMPPPGILMDIGAHTIDLLCWWLGSDPVVQECRTDSYGGPEARAQVLLDFHGATARIDLSYYQKLANRFRLDFEHGWIEGNPSNFHRFTLHQDGRTRVVRRPWCDPARLMITNLVGAIGGRNAPLVSGRDVLPSIKVIYAAYCGAQPFDEPWLPRPCEAL